jgi:hypothetical protein
MKKLLIAVILGCLFAGCNSITYGTGKMPAEDIEVPVKYSRIIKVLKDPSIPVNSREKYYAAKELIKHVDMTITRETKTLNDIFYFGDAIVDDMRVEDPTISFNYQYENHYIRFSFATYRNFVLRVDITEKGTILTSCTVPSEWQKKPPYTERFPSVRLPYATEKSLPKHAIVLKNCTPLPDTPNLNYSTRSKKSSAIGA